MDYSEKLRQFNDSAKYAEEMRLMRLLVNPHCAESLVDIGCGLGTLTAYLGQFCVVKGYDVTDYLEYPIEREPNPFKNSLIAYHHATFMHSFAHISNPEEVIETINAKRLHIITPNKLWLDALPHNPNYKPDPTVIQHYTLESLKAMFRGYEIEVMGQYGESIDNQCERIFLTVRKW